MKTKTIEKVLEKKLTAWVNTIEDNNVRALVKRNAIVTGGSIASMLLNEKVNDFDVYFRTKETVLAVARYYASKVPQASIEVVDGASTQILSEKREFAEMEEPSQCQRAVFLRDLQPDRVAIYVPGVNYYSVTGEGSLMAEPDEIEQTKELFSSIEEAREQVKEGSYSPLFFTANAITLSDQIQLVLRFYGEASELHVNYDFVHATNYYDYYERKLYTNKPALESLLAKELRYVGSLYPVTSIIRTKKFIKRGWTITAGEYLKIMFQVADLDLRDPAVLTEQCLGVDLAFFSIFIEALQNRDTTKHEQVTYSYICELIDRIFN